MYQLVALSLAAMFTLTHAGCNAFGKQVKAGSVFSLPGQSHCMQYKCINGVGKLHKEACEIDGKCYPVGLTFVVDCATYVCHKVLENKNSVYKATFIKADCQDNKGRCYTPGGVTFPRIVGGVLFNRCSCRAAVTGHVTYSCQQK